MAKYTTRLCNILESYDPDYKKKSYNEIIEDNVSKLFDFDFPIFDEEYRNVLEIKICKHFYMEEIGFETVGLFKLRLDTTLNEIMPYYNKLYLSEKENIDYFSTKNYQEEFTSNDSKSQTDTNNTTVDSTSNKTTTNDITHGGTITDSVENTQSSTNTTNTTDNNKSTFSDTPQGLLNGQDYATNYTVDNNSSDTTNTTSNNLNGETTKTFNNTDNESGNENLTNNQTSNANFNSKITNTNEYIRKIVGYDNINPNELLRKYRENIINIDMMIIDELKKLFMLLY